MCQSGGPCSSSISMPSRKKTWSAASNQAYGIVRRELRALEQAWLGRPVTGWANKEGEATLSEYKGSARPIEPAITQLISGYIDKLLERCEVRDPAFFHYTCRSEESEPWLICLETKLKKKNTKRERSRSRARGRRIYLE